MGIFPEVASGPQLVEGLVFFDHQVDVVVGGLFVASKQFALVEHFRCFVTALQLSPDFLSLLSNLLIIIN